MKRRTFMQMMVAVPVAVAAGIKAKPEITKLSSGGGGVTIDGVTLYDGDSVLMAGNIEDEYSPIIGEVRYSHGYHETEKLHSVFWDGKEWIRIG